MNKIEKENHLFAAFSYFDKDGSGYITADELQHACDEFGINVPLEELLQDVDQDNVSSLVHDSFVASNINIILRMLVKNLIFIESRSLLRRVCY